MALELSELKNELAHFGAENDAREVERGRRMLNITPDTGEFLAVLVRFGTARRVLEIGTSNGYSTLWLAESAAAIDGHVTTLEYAEDKAAMARDTFARSGLADRITLVHDDAGPWLAEAADASIDLLFLDSDRGQYAGWWPQLVIALMLFLLLRIKAQFEESLLRKAYPKYAAYAAKTPMFFPRLGK